MKQCLLSSSAVAIALALASPAASAEWEIKVGGYAEQQQVLASSNDNGHGSQNFDAVNPELGAELLFRPSIKFDNGPTIGTDVQFEGFTIRDQIDESYMFITGSLGGFDAAVSGRWGTADSASSDNPEVWGAGIRLGYGGFTVGGSFSEQNNVGVANGEAYDAGILYETGPWGVSFTYFHGENSDKKHLASSGHDEEMDAFMVGATYKLAEGVSINGFGAYVELNEDVSDSGVGSGEDIDGFVIGTGIKINF